MFRGILRSLTMLAALVAAYQAYVLLAVPLMEPTIEKRQAQGISQQKRELAKNSATKYQLLLSNYFPKDHWSQTRPPKVFASSNEKAMLVLDDYTRHAESHVDNERFTQVDIARFALLMFPTPPREGITPPRDTVILEAPQGARLKFDEFRPELGKIGQITGGKFPGRITIRSDMREPGVEDDMLIETADLEMNTKLLYSLNPVRFRMGRNVGGGRELEIRFLEDEHVRPKSAGLKIAGIDSLEIRRDVRMRLELETSSLLPGDKEKEKEPSPGPVRPSSPQASQKGSGSEEPKPPVEVTCSGPFTFDFVRYVASLDRDVELRQINTNGPSDQLICSQLDIHFAAKPPKPNELQPVVLDPGKRQQSDLGRLEPATIVAQGHPVVVTSPQRNAQARGDRIQIGLRDQRVRVAAANDALLVYGTNVLRAPVIDYQHPARGSSATIGRFRATGPGSLDYVPDPLKPQQVFRAAWQTMVDLGREKGQPVLTLDGRPQLAFTDAGSLTADRIKVYLRELQGAGSAGAVIPLTGSGSGSEKLQMAPDRLIAGGRVDIRSAQLTARTGELLVAFRLQQPAADPVASSGAQSGAAPASQVARGLPKTPPRQAFHVEADKMQMDVRVQGQELAPATLACDGNVIFREVPLTPTEEQPLEITGGQVTVDRLDTAAPYVTLRGPGPGEAPGSKKAQLAGRGITMFVDVIELDGRDNRMWSDGPGKATLLVTRDLEGQAANTPVPLDITWQGGLQFDGRTIFFERGVQVAGADDTLHCDRLAGRLSAPIVFGEGIDQKAIDLTEIECVGRVTINHLSRDQAGVTSHERMELARLTINQQTGSVSGDGPGVIRSTRFGAGLAALAGAQNPAAPRLTAPPPGAPGSKLHFLRVDFRKGLNGNFITREMTFEKEVQVVYGPVDAWEQELDLRQPESLPPDAMTLTCDEMRINEDPVAARVAANPGLGQNKPIGPVQLQAKGNVRIEGQSPSHGAFTAQAARASYEQAKDVFMLNGDGRTKARLWRAGQQGAPPEVDWIRYVRSTGELTVGGIQYVEITPGDLESARRPKPVR